MYRRLPKSGFKSLYTKKIGLISVGKIQSLIDQKILNLKEEINLILLKKLKLIDATSIKIRILGNGKLGKKIHIIADSTTTLAKEKIEKSGGSIQIIGVDTEKL